MPLNSLSYFLFLPVVFLIHYFSPDRFRWLVLLSASFCFYAALKVPHLIAVLLLITIITYFTGICLDRYKSTSIRQYLLWVGVSANVLTLIILKYLSLITQNLNIVLAPSTTIPVSEAVVAIGASYFIFQGISYLIDIYLEVEKPEHHFGHFALYMSFFPKLLQGPIERGSNLLPQFKIPYVFNYENTRSGMLLFSLGLLKKVVIADRIAVMVNPVFDNVHMFKGFPLLLATYYYSLQIYFDFSGYTDMALGTAMIFNIKLTQNFDNPYFATSIADFWRRWHISFSSWILDYVFKPLQMSWRDFGSWGIALALLVTFTISGVWHGANWGYVIWGALHGIYMAISIPYKGIKKKMLTAFKIDGASRMLKLVNIFIVFNLVTVAWIFFRTKSINDALYVIYNFFVVASKIFDVASLNNLLSFNLNLYVNKESVEVITLFIYVVIITLIENVKSLTDIQRNCKTLSRWSFYTFIISSIMLFGIFGKNEFIYSRY